MPKYIYKARLSNGKIVTGEIEAINQREAVDRLRSMKYVVTEIKEFKESSLKTFLSKISPFKGKVKSSDLTVFSRQLATLVSSGVPLVQGLSILEEQFESVVFKNVIRSIRTDIESGVSISEAMKKHPQVFSELYIGMIHAGEVGGILDQVLDRLSSYLEAAEELKAKIKGAMMYPIIVSLVAVGAAVVMLTLVVPRFAALFSEMGAQLPAPTQMLVNLSHFVKRWIWLFILSGIIIFAIFRKLYSSNYKFALQVDTFLLKAPIVGGVIQKTAIAKFTRTLGTLVKSGVPILQSLETVAKTAGNKLIEKVIMQARESIREGERISEPLKKSGVFPPMVIQMIAVGEETGALDAMLTKIADFYDREVAAAIEGLTGMIEPLIIVFLGVVVGGMVVAMYLPMFEITSKMAGG
ncbi:MAG: type II secretion system F family protein [Elusimicrobiota bacterium]|nr:type II secretion system F family protein [Endomicrobiia bacterium]MCX7910356.1 type II secretion system F family protein [Endomicrobiia bacterium]MDW8165554.1 type II secretion system F family protein [Elusimicrobiota bacterium]